MIKIKPLNKILLYLFIFFNLIINLNFIFFNSFTNEFQQFTLVSSIILIFSIPSFFYYFNHQKYNNIPIVEVILLFFLISYLTVFIVGSEYVFRSFFWMVSEIPIEQNEVLLKLFEDPYEFLRIFYYSVISFFIGYCVIFFFINNKSNFILKKINYNFFLKDNHFFFLSLIFFFIKLNLFIFPKLVTFNLINQFKEVILIFLSICCSHVIFEHKKLILKVISVLILIISFFISISETGSQIGITLMLISMVMIYWFLKKKIFFLGILIIVFNFYFFQDIKIEYREKIKNYSIELRSPFIKIFNYYETTISGLDIFKYIYPQGNKDIDINIDQDIDKDTEFKSLQLKNKNWVNTVRLTMSSVALNFLINKHNEDQLNLKNGKTYKPLPLFFVPRFLWPDKPTSSFGVEYGIVTGIAEPNYETSINLSWISESFWNFGRYFYFAMFFKGIILSFLSFLIIYKKNCVLFYSWLATIIPLLIAENNFSLMISPIFFKFIFLIIIVQLFKLCFVSNEKNKIIS